MDKGERDALLASLARRGAENRAKRQAQDPRRSFVSGDPFGHLPAPWPRAIEEFLASIEDISGSKKSAAGYRSMLAMFWSINRDPAAVTRAAVTSFRSLPSASNRNPGAAVSVSTKNSRLTVVSSLFTYCSTYELPGGAMLWNRALPTIGLRALKPVRIARSLSEDELARLFACIDRTTIGGARDYAMLLFYLLTARRKSEIQRLTYASLSYGIIADGQSRKMAWSMEFYGKGHSREVDRCEVPQLVMDALTAYWKLDGRYPLQPDSPLFASVYEDGRKRPLGGTWIAQRFKFYAAQAGLSPLYTLHSLRHSSARIRFESGATVRDVQRALRHTSLDTTQRYLEVLVSASDPGAALVESRLPFLATSASNGSEASR